MIKYPCQKYFDQMLSFGWFGNNIRPEILIVEQKWPPFYVFSYAYLRMKMFGISERFHWSPLDYMLSLAQGVLSSRIQDKPWTEQYWSSTVAHIRTIMPVANKLQSTQFGSFKGMILLPLFISLYTMIWLLMSKVIYITSACQMSVAGGDNEDVCAC